MKNFAYHPDKPFVITDDHKAQAFLSQMNVLERLKGAAADPRLFSHHVRLDIWDHPTHWITAVYFVGFKCAKENGFKVRGFPKSQVSREVFEAQFEAEKHQEFSRGLTQANDDLPPIGTN